MQVRRSRLWYNVLRMKKTSKSPFRIGWESAKANAVPIFVLWAVAVLMVAGYYLVPGVSSALEPLAGWQSENGSVGAVLNRVVTCGILPGIFLLLLPSLRPPRPMTTIVIETLWFGFQSVLVLWFYELQSVWFGDGNDLECIVKKTLLDQFAWTVFIIAPMNSLFFPWVGSDFSLEFLRSLSLWKWKDDIYMPNLVMNWCVWIPTVMAIYAFPFALQTHIAGIMGAIWTLLCLQFGSRVGK